MPRHRPSSVVLLLVLAGCASMRPDRTIDGVNVYIRSQDEVERYCYTRIQASQRAAHPGGCWVPSDNRIMVADGWRAEAVLTHELRHAHGEDHSGPCSAYPDAPDGRQPDGKPCRWHRR